MSLETRLVDLAEALGQDYATTMLQLQASLSAISRAGTDADFVYEYRYPDGEPVEGEA